MWVIAGVLLGFVVLGSLLGFVAGPHSHVFAGVLGAVTAAWLLAMVIAGQSAPLLWALFSADVVVTAGVGTLAWRGLKGRRELPGGASPLRITGAFGIAESALAPGGLVRVQGETWSATSLNGPVRAGGTVQVIGVQGVRLEVWGEENPSPGVPSALDALDLADLADLADKTPDAAQRSDDAESRDDQIGGTT